LRAGAAHHADPAAAGPLRHRLGVQRPRHPPPAAAGARPGRAALLRRRRARQAQHARTRAQVGVPDHAGLLLPGEQQPAAGLAHPARAPQHGGLPGQADRGDHRAAAGQLLRPAHRAGGAGDPRLARGRAVTAPSQTPAALLTGQRVLVCDGAMGTMLHAAGAALDRSLPELNLTDPGLVRTIHESYLSAGADIIQANTFGANRLWLGDHGVGDKVAEVNRAGVRIARAAQDRCERDVLVAGSVSPAVTGLQRRRTGSAERAEVLREQIEALLGRGEGPGVDILILETFGYLDELVEAVGVASELSDVPIVAQATFADDAHTLGGETPREVATVLSGLPVAMLGTNCTIGPQRMLTVAEDLVRGCCGTTPAHIRAAAGAVTAIPARARRTHPAGTGISGTVISGSGTPAPPGSVPFAGTLADQLAGRRFIVAAAIASGGRPAEAVQAAAVLQAQGAGVFAVLPAQSARTHS